VNVHSPVNLGAQGNYFSGALSISTYVQYNASAEDGNGYGYVPYEGQSPFQNLLGEQGTPAFCSLNGSGPVDYLFLYAGDIYYYPSLLGASATAEEAMSPWCPLNSIGCTPTLLIPYTSDILGATGLVCGDVVNGDGLNDILVLTTSSSGKRSALRAAAGPLID
jgi:hypothetical protein